MAKPPDQMPAAAGRGRLRASHADRERVIDTLKAAFVQGRLAKDEFDLRVGQTLASRTYAELAAVTADLPAGLTAARLPNPAQAQGESPVPRPGRLFLGASAVEAGMWAFVFFAPDSYTDKIGAFLLFWVVTIIYVMILIIAGRQKLGALHLTERASHSTPRPRARSPFRAVGTAGGQFGRKL